MPNLETILPRLSHYKTILSDGGQSFNDSFLKEIGELFDQSKWEDRLLMLALIMQRSKLQEDPRPPFAKWIKEEIKTINEDYQDGDDPYCIYNDCLVRYGGWIAKTEFLSPKPLSNSGVKNLNHNNLRSLITDWEKLSSQSKQDSLTLCLMGAYLEIYPESLVKPTRLGADCLLRCKGDLASASEIKGYIDNLYYSLISFIENLYKNTVSLRQSSENLYLHRYDTDWQEIIHITWKIDLLSWWYREYLTGTDNCWQVDIAEIPFSEKFEDSNSYFTDYLLPVLFKTYGIDCKDYKKNCYSRMFAWYSGDEYEIEIEDRWRDAHTYWTGKYGDL